MNSLSKKGERFLRRVEAAAELNVSVMASSQYPLASSENSVSAARRMVGGRWRTDEDHADDADWYMRKVDAALARACVAPENP